MAYDINESDLENICAQCRKPHGHSIVLQMHNHKIYESITCVNCGYENVRSRPEGSSANTQETFHKIKTER